jgi:hypothetical protein
MRRFGSEAIIGSSISFGLVILILLTMVVQPTYADNGVSVNVSTENKVVSFNISSGNDSPAIYGLIVTVQNGHYSKITESPAGWSAGIIKYKAVMWTTKNHPIKPGDTEGSFVMEIRQSGRYTINWSVTDNTMQPIAWGTTTITI